MKLVAFAVKREWHPLLQSSCRIWLRRSSKGSMHISAQIGVMAGPWLAESMHIEEQDTSASTRESWLEGVTVAPTYGNLPMISLK
jgi:hypothetical protein